MRAQQNGTEGLSIFLEVENQLLQTYIYISRISGSETENGNRLGEPNLVLKFLLYIDRDPHSGSHQEHITRQLPVRDFPSLHCLSHA